MGWSFDSAEKCYFARPPHARTPPASNCYAAQRAHDATSGKWKKAQDGREEAGRAVVELIYARDYVNCNETSDMRLEAIWDQFISHSFLEIFMIYSNLRIIIHTCDGLLIFILLCFRSCYIKNRLHSFANSTTYNYVDLRIQVSIVSDATPDITTTNNSCSGFPTASSSTGNYYWSLNLTG